jgi:hypothetical protein
MLKIKRKNSREKPKNKLNRVVQMHMKDTRQISGYPQEILC